MLKQFTVNGQTYTLDAISASEAMSFGFECAEALAPLIGGLGQLKNVNLQSGQENNLLLIAASAASGFNAKKVEVIGRKAVNYVITSKNEYLKNADVFERHFTQENPKGLLVVPLVAAWELARPFLPDWLTTIAQNTSLKMKSAAAESASSTPQSSGS
jgi:hypothetical protein